ncbi:hypothetical protein TNCV_3557461 [Trichonephila clavipes]|uniref:Uncharacterized protein n=1 Tax=Trichonephila clavipes TaxID=2585209 RepID=A0A8X7BIB6_TRICX|nr:hypothetical protein TNCV_3557461 [Trichonephila clavipes]
MDVFSGKEVERLPIMDSRLEWKAAHPFYSKLGSSFVIKILCYSVLVLHVSVLPPLVCCMYPKTKHTTTITFKTKLNSVAQQPMRAKAYYAQLISLRCNSIYFRPGGESDMELPMFSSKESLILIYRPSEGMKDNFQKIALILENATHSSRRLRL